MTHFILYANDLLLTRSFLRCDLKKKSIISTTAPSTSFRKDTPGPKKIDWSLLYVCDHSHKLSSIPLATKKRRTNISKHTGCTTKVKATKCAVDSIIEVMYHWTYDGHNPFSEQDIKESRLPFDVKIGLKTC
ncbi:hypothetical protein BDC45DRAFT_542771 [Circinella umbellata]|nr:hypothetical protein BDC45DRAFT_542771 [Circinella umbellata]